MRAVVLASATLSAVVLAAVRLRRRWIVVTVVGGSMLPTLQHGDVVLARRCDAREVSVGDIVVIERPVRDHRWMSAPAQRASNDRSWLVKRVAAIPGDRLPVGVTAAEDVVPPQALAVLGDNGGYDSRAFGLLPFDRLLAVVVRAPFPWRPQAIERATPLRLNEVGHFDPGKLRLFNPDSGERLAPDRTDGGELTASASLYLESRSAWEHVLPPPTDYSKAEIAAFVHNVEHDQPLSPNDRDGLLVDQAVDAAYRSARTFHWQCLPDDPACQ